MGMADRSRVRIEGARDGPGGSDRPPAVRSPQSTWSPERTAALCDLCGAAMLGRHCKLVCGGCGYTRDCSDP